jgi:hypothetical protein
MSVSARGNKPSAHKQLAYEQAIATKPKPAARKPKPPVLPPFQTTTIPEPQPTTSADSAPNATGASATQPDQGDRMAAAPQEDAGAPNQAQQSLEGAGAPGEPSTIPPDVGAGPYADMPPMPGDGANGPSQWDNGDGDMQGPDAADQQGPDGYPAYGGDWVQVVVSGAAMRASASEDAPMLFAFPYGRNLRVVSHYEGWVEVTDPQSAATGWMQESFLAPAGTVQPGYGQDQAFDDQPGRRHPGLFQPGGFADLIQRAFGGGGY